MSILATFPPVKSMYTIVKPKKLINLPHDTPVTHSTVYDKVGTVLGFVVNENMNLLVFYLGEDGLVHNAYIEVLEQQGYRLLANFY